MPLSDLDRHIFTPDEDVFILDQADSLARTFTDFRTVIAIVTANLNKKLYKDLFVLEVLARYQSLDRIRAIAGRVRENGGAMRSIHGGRRQIEQRRRDVASIASESTVLDASLFSGGKTGTSVARRTKRPVSRQVSTIKALLASRAPVKKSRPLTVKFGARKTKKTKPSKPPPLSLGQEAEKLKQYVGKAAKDLIRPAFKQAPHPVWRELAKLASKDPKQAGYNLAQGIYDSKQRANQYMHQVFVTEIPRQLRPDERVFRAWIPFDPNDSDVVHGYIFVSFKERPDFQYRPDSISVRTKHNMTRSSIIRLIEDQLDSTEEVFSTMLSTRMSVAFNALPIAVAAEQKMYHTVSTLRLKGVEVTEYYCKGGYERMEIFFEDPRSKMGVWTCG